MPLTTEGPGPCGPPEDPCECPDMCEDDSSSNPVRYGSGKVLLEQVDVETGIPGLLHSRTFQNRNYALQDWNSAHGWNWAATAWPYIVRRTYEPVPGTTIESITMKRGMKPLWFDKLENGSFVCRYRAKERNFLEHKPAQGIYLYTHIDGTSVEQIEFQDFNQPETVRGLMKKRIDTNGYAIEALSYGDKTITGLKSLRDGVMWRLQYEFFASGDFVGKVSSARIEKEVSGVTTQLRRTRYEYYSGTTDEGLLGDLKAAIQQQPVAGSPSLQWEDIAVHYYRYHVSGPHLLKYVVSPSTYARLKQAGQNVLTMLTTAGGQDLVPDYADHYFEYDGVNRVIKEIARTGDKSTGINGLDYTRLRNPNIKRNNKTVKDEAGYNTWYWKVEESGQPGYRNLVYTNKIGQPLAKVKVDLAQAGRRWIETTYYNGDGQVTLRASAAAVKGINENFADLIGANQGASTGQTGGFSLLKAHEGLITRTFYYASTTATATVPGGVKGYVDRIYIQQGYLGSLIPQRKVTYLASNNASGTLLYVEAENTVFKDENDSPASRITTRYEYNWYQPSGGLPVRIREKITHHPLIPIAEGGDGFSAVSREFFDEHGNLIWTMDERGIITKRSYDLSRSLLMQEIRDYSGPDLPSGWSALPGAHTNETTDYQHDDRSRLLQILGPEHEAVWNNQSLTLRRTQSFCYVTPPITAQALNQPPVFEQVRSAGGFVSGGNQQIIDPVTIELRDFKDRTWHQIVSKRSAGSGPLSPTDTFLRADWSRWTHFLYDERSLKIAERVYFDIPASLSGLAGVNQDTGSVGTNYDETEWGYAENSSMLLRQRYPEGTIRRLVYDSLERLSSAYTGTQDVPGGSSLTWRNWQPGLSGTNIVEVTRNEYDLGQGGGNSNLTAVLQFVDTSKLRETRLSYDFRNRLTLKDGEVDFYQEFAYDNLNRIIEVRQRNGSADGNLVALIRNYFNSRNWIYELRRYAVNPQTGDLGNYLIGSTAYDPVGNVIASSEPNEASKVAWTQYDNLNRLTIKSVGFYGNTTSPSQALVVESWDFVYDPAGNNTATVQKQIDTNSLVSTPTYRTSYTWSWPDPLGRQVATVQLGALAAATPRPSLPPARSDVELVTSYFYSTRGELESVIDPMAHPSHLAYDDKGRLVQRIENFVSPGTPGTPNAGCNRTTELSYTPDDQVKVLKVLFPDSQQNQLTTWVYGTDLGTSLVASNQYLRKKVYNDSTETLFSYNRQGQITKKEEANGTIHSYEFDGLGRLVHDRVPQIGINVFDSVLRLSYAYEVRGMLSSAISATTAEGEGTAALNEVALIYDDFGFLQMEFQEHSGKAVVKDAYSKHVSYFRANGNGNTTRLLGVRYPSDQVFNLDYGDPGSIDQKLSRVAKVSELYGSNEQEQVAYKYLGLDMTVRVAYEAAATLLDLWGGSIGQYTGLDRFGRLIDYPWKVSGTAKVQLRYGYDRNGNRLYREDVIAKQLGKNFDELYAYDGLSQITHLNRGILNTSHNGLEPGSQTFAEQFTFDTIGNWPGYQQSDASPVINQTRTHNGVNEITGISETLGAGWTQPVYNAVGDTVLMPQPAEPNKAYRIDYDPWGRVGMVYQVNSPTDKLRVVRHHHDALNRRIRTWNYNALSKFESLQDFYYDDRWRRIEEYQGNAEPDILLRKQYLWDYAANGHPDALILRKTFDATGEVIGLQYALQDAHFNTVALLENDGTIMTRYSYSAFGTAQFLNVDFEPVAGNLLDMAILYSGYHIDSKTGLYHVRYRDYHALLGRWINRDPIMERGGLNMYGFVQNNGINEIDILGLMGPGSQPPITQEKDAQGKVTTKINKCNIVIFIGHNGTVPQGPIKNDPCSAAHVISCGGAINNTNPGVPESPIPGAPPPTPPDSKVRGDAAIQQGYDAFEAGKKHAKTICKDPKACCKKVDVSVDCSGLPSYMTNSLIGVYQGVCNLKHTETC